MLSSRPLKLAMPLLAASVVVPAAKTPDDKVTWMLSLLPVLGLTMRLPYWSSMVTVSETVLPAVIDDAGSVVMKSFDSAAGLTVTVGCVVRLTSPVAPCSDAVVKGTAPTAVGAVASA